MAEKIRFSSGIHVFGNTLDRFVGGGYKEDRTLEQMFEDASKVKDLEGIELVANWHINEKNIDQVRELAKKYGFTITMIVVDIFTQAKWSGGSFTAGDPEIRKDAIRDVKKYMDIAAELGCDIIDLWFAHDGYDYSFQSDFAKSWNYIIEGLKECADYRKDIRLGVEYKVKEPRTHCHIGTIGKVLALLSKVQRDNVGVVVDVGHSLFAYENVAETVALCKIFDDKLFHMHLNDNYRCWDDDMMVGSVHLQEYLELLYWLKKVDYRGWYSLDIFPYREDGIKAANESIEWLKAMINAVGRLDEKAVEEVISRKDAVSALALMRKMIFK